MIRTNTDGSELFNGEEEFILTDQVDFGFRGAYGEESVWMPSYMLDDYPDFNVPDSLHNKNPYRQMLIDAASGSYSGASSDATDFISLYNPDWGETAEFDTPRYDRPTVWTSTT